jgi:hypothetical protein
MTEKPEKHTPPVGASLADAPGCWRNETSGVLAPVVEAYLSGETLTYGQVVVMKAYLRQWIMAPGFIGVAALTLRRAVEQIRAHRDIAEWLEAAEKAGIDPL